MNHGVVQWEKDLLTDVIEEANATAKQSNDFWQRLPADAVHRGKSMPRIVLGKNTRYIVCCTSGK
jgi:hypothetical protein